MYTVQQYRRDLWQNLTLLSSECFADWAAMLDYLARNDPAFPDMEIRIIVRPAAPGGEDY